MLDVKHVNINKEPIPHLIINHPIPVNDYNRLYELWNKPDHETWKTLCEKHNVEINFKSELKANAHRNKNEYVGYWFFRDRSDKRPIHIKFGTINVKYAPNVLFICDSNLNFTVKKQEVDMPDMLNCHVYFNDQRQIKEFLSL